MTFPFPWRCEYTRCVPSLASDGLTTDGSWRPRIYSTALTWTFGVTQKLVVFSIEDGSRTERSVGGDLEHQALHHHGIAAKRGDRFGNGGLLRAECDARPVRIPAIVSVFCRRSAWNCCRTYGTGLLIAAEIVERMLAPGPTNPVAERPAQTAVEASRSARSTAIVTGWPRTSPFASAGACGMSAAVGFGASATSS